MLEAKSKKYQLDIEAVKRLLQKAIIFYTPVILALLTQLQNWNIDYKVLYAMAVWITIDLLRRFFTDYSKAK